MAWINEANWPEAWSEIGFSPMMRSGSDYIVYAGGYNIAKFYKYNLTTQTWTELAVPPGAIYGAISMSPDGTKLAAHIVNGSQLFIYTIATNSWATSAVAPVLSTGGAAQIWTTVWADNDTIWSHVRDAVTSGKNKCYKYVVSTNTWTQYTNVYTLGPYTVSSCMSVNSAGTALYFGGVFSGADRSLGVKYVIATDTYSQITIGSGWDYNQNSDRSAKLWHIDATTAYAGTRYYNCDTEAVSGIIFPNDSLRDKISQYLACGIYATGYIIAWHKTTEPKNRSYLGILPTTPTSGVSYALGRRNV